MHHRRGVLGLADRRPRPRATRSRSRSISCAERYRSAGSLASARMTTRSRSCGTSGRSVDGGSRHLREVLHRDLDRRLAVERHRAGEQLVEQDPGRVEVGALVDRRAARLLGGEVLGGADDRAGLRHLARAARAIPKSITLTRPSRSTIDVVRLHVAVDDPGAMREAQRGEDLAHVGDRDGHGARPSRDDQLFQRAALDVLHRR